MFGKTKNKIRAVQRRDAPHYRLWQALYMAFYSSKLYVDIGLRWRGLGVCYFFMLIACVTLPVSIRLIVVMNHYLSEQLIEPLDNLPPIHLHYGEVLFSEPMPYFVKSARGHVVTIVDTTDHIQWMNLEKYPNLMLLITKHDFYFRMPPIPLFSDLPADPEMSRIRSEHVDPSVSERFIGREWLDAVHARGIKTFFLYAFYPSFMLFISMFMLGLMFAVAAAGQFFAQVMFKFKLGYVTALRFVMVTITPAMVLLFGLMAIDQLIQGIIVYCIALFGLYFCFAVLQLKYASRSMALCSF